MRTLGKVLALIVFVGSMPSIMKADGIDFSGNTGGTVAFSPTLGQSLNVNNAPIDQLWRLSQAGTIYSFSPNLNGSGTTGALNFSTGGATQLGSNDVNSPNYNPFCGAATCASFGAGSSPSDLTITGTLFQFDNNVAHQIASGTLLTGAFRSGTAAFDTGVGNLSGLFSVTSVDPNMMAALFGGTPAGPERGSISEVDFNINWVADSSLSAGGFYQGTIGSTNVIDNIPEPAGLLLLGTGLLAGAGILRKRILKSENNRQRDGLF